MLILHFLVFSVLCFWAESKQNDYIENDFNKVVESFGKNIAASHKRTLEWVDAYGRHPALQSNPAYAQYQVTADILGEVKYGEIKETVTRPGWTFKQWIHNNMSVRMTSKFMKSKVMIDEFKWSVDAKLNFAKDHLVRNFTFMIPPSLGLDQKNFTKEFPADEVIFGLHAEQHHMEKDVFNISQEITVPPKKSVEATVSISEKEVKIPWSVDVLIDGYFAMWVEPQWAGHWLWFYPVTRLADSFPQFKRYGSKLKYTVTGEFTSVFSTAAHLHFKEFELGGRKLRKP